MDKRPAATNPLPGVGTPPALRGTAASGAFTPGIGQGGRRLSDAERRDLQARRRARLEPVARNASAATADEPDDPVTPTGAGTFPPLPENLFAPPRRPVEEINTATPRANGTLPAAAAPVVDGPRVRPRTVPTMPGRKQQTNSRPMAVLGAVLLIGLSILAFAGGRIFGGGGPSSPDEMLIASGFPTPSANAAAGVPAIPTAVIPEGQRAPIVCIDPGHGGPDYGFTQFWDVLGFELVEKNLTLEHGWDLEARLKQHGYTVVMTRRTDVAVNARGTDINGDGMTGNDDTPGTNQHRNRNLDEFQARIDVCNDAGADLLVSLHVNGYSNSIPRGYETWYTEEREFGERNAAFAWLAYDALKEQLATVGYTVPAAIERGANPDRLSDVQTPNTIFKHFIMLGPAAPGLIVPSAMPGAIVEALFVSNDMDAAVLSTPSGRNAIVTAYEQAIVEYFQEYPPS